MTQSGRAYFLVPIVYIGVIFGLLFLQFSGGERFTRSVGPLTLNATRGAASDDGTPEVRELGISFDGIAFSFAEESGLIVETSDDVADMRAVGYEVLDGGFEVEFEGGYALSGVREGTSAVIESLLEPTARELDEPAALEAGSLLRTLVDRTVEVHGARIPGLGSA